MAEPDTTIPVEYVREALDVDPGGGLRWRERPRKHFTSDAAWRSWNGRWAGKSAGTLHEDGHFDVHLTFGGKQRRLKARRVAWTLMHGAWRDGDLDHRDGMRDC